MSCMEEILNACEGTPRMFGESVVSAYRHLFEDGEQPVQQQQAQQTEKQQQNAQPIPVNAQNVVSSDAASTIPAQLTAAQAAQTAVDEEKKKLAELQTKADNQIGNLRDTLAVASEEKPDGQA